MDKNDLKNLQIENIISMAWSDDVSFEEIKRKHSLSEAEIIKIMRRNLKAKSFANWRKRVSGRISKHEKLAKFKASKSFSIDL